MNEHKNRIEPNRRKTSVVVGSDREGREGRDVPS